MRVFLFLVLTIFGLRAQDPLPLKEAVRLALRNNQSIQAAGAGLSAAESRITEVRGALLPRVNYSESWTRSNNPVYVFSSLLTQHQFNEANFLIGPLNRPDALNNFQSLVTADQILFDAKRTSHAVREAGLSRDAAQELNRQAKMETIAAAVRAYYDAVLGAEQLNAAVQAKRSAEADLRRAETVRAAGMSTDSDVLSIRVHLAAVDEQRIRRSADLDVAYAALNEVLGLPLDAPHELAAKLTAVSVPDLAIADYEQTAIAERPEAREASLAMKVAETKAAGARSNLWPRVAAHFAFEADRQTFYEKGGANWLASIGMQWTIFDGLSNRAQIQESNYVVTRSEAERARTTSGIKLQVRRAFAGLRAAEQRIEVAKASVAEAEESLRIIQNRYSAGMSTITDLLRTETAALDARTRYLTAIHDQRLAATMLEFAAGRLTENSEVLN